MPMTLNPKEQRGLSKTDASFLKIIDEFGWHVMSVAPRAGDEGDLWVYSTGLFFSFKHPEVVVFNLDLSSLSNVVNSIGKRVKAGEQFVPGANYQGIFEGRECQFREVDRSQFAEYVGFSLWFYELEDFPMLQAFWL